jgi:hypothetical protein
MSGKDPGAVSVGAPGEQPAPAPLAGWRRARVLSEGRGRSPSGPSNGGLRQDSREQPVQAFPNGGLRQDSREQPVQAFPSGGLRQCRRATICPSNPLPAVIASDPKNDTR